MNGETPISVRRSRRELLRSGAAAFFAGVGLSAILAACGPAAAPPSPTSAAPDTPVYNGIWSKRPTSATDQNAGVVWPWINTSFFNNVYHSANQWTTTGVNGTGNDPKADQMYQAAVAELDDAKAKQLWRQLMHYGYDTMWTNIELVEVPTYFAVGPKVGAFTNRSWLNIWDSYVGIQHAA